ncbi:MAG TPA: tRNA guanosine(34) transglycosylase Tgt [Candidatus Saccharimonadales bacterium]|nr:tRNA guanosine(34) transglycosylase Tgt [Candidatus Saccharimonadales bacterium]
MKALDFVISDRLPGTLARAGEITTAHGTIRTPAFIVGGTKATVKALTPAHIEELGGQAVLANTYHLMLQPGAATIQQAGGLGAFMHWSKPTFTDSGGFQVFSLGMAYKKGIDATSHSTKGDSTLATHNAQQLATVTDEGVTFRSHLDGSTHHLTPERSMELQHAIGADIHMAFDELTSPLAAPDYVRRAMDRTHAWAERCLTRHAELNTEHVKDGQNEQALYGVVQGARDESMRRESAQFLGSREFDGFGIGGVFEPDEISSVVRWVTETLPDDKPRHLLGMGAQPADLFLGVEYGIDTFDCVAPTRQARNAAVYTPDGRINILNAKFKVDFSPISSECGCYTCQNFTKAYLHHLFKADEMLGATLASIHNEYFVVHLVDAIRDSLIHGTFFELKAQWFERYYKT